MDKRLHPPLPPKKVTLESLIPLIPITAKVYDALLLNHIKSEMEEILMKNQNGFQRNQSTTSILMICQIIEGVCAKILRQHDCL